VVGSTQGPLYGLPSSSGDDGPALQARLSDVSGLSVSADSTLYWCERLRGRCRKLVDGIVRLVAGRAPPAGSSAAAGDGYNATDAVLKNPKHIVHDAVSGNIYIACSDTVRQVSALSGVAIISTFVGPSTESDRYAACMDAHNRGDNVCDQGDGAPANTFANNLEDFEVAPSGNIIWTERGRGAVRGVAPAGFTTAWQEITQSSDSFCALIAVKYVCELDLNFNALV
jgi:hypothetical protein